MRVKRGERRTGLCHDGSAYGKDGQEGNGIFQWK